MAKVLELVGVLYAAPRVGESADQAPVKTMGDRACPKRHDETLQP